MARAEVIDIRSCRPKADDRFFVDTNIWKSLTYSTATLDWHKEKDEGYSAFLNQCAKVKCALFYSSLSFCELSSVIERCEWDIYNEANDQSVSLKEFRQGTRERGKVIDEVRSAWSQVEGLGSCLNLNITVETLAAARKNWQEYPLDGYDIFFLEEMKAADISQIITDDRDFISVPDITVFTANSNALKEAALYRTLRART